MAYEEFSAERHAFDTTYRIGQLNKTRKLFGLEPTEVVSGQAGDTVGIEIEMTWPQAFPDMAPWDRADVRPKDLAKDSAEYRAFCEAYDRNERRLLPKLKQLEAFIPRIGRDAYWEFSFRPSKHVEILVAEVEMLYQAGILHDGYQYATHLTLAGRLNNSDAHAMLYMLEQMGGSTPQRLTSAVGWSRKGSGGMRQRYHHELLGQDMAGVEFRSLVTTSPNQIGDSLRLAQALGRMQREEPEQWMVIRGAAFEHLRGLRLPLNDWPKPKDDPGLWDTYAGSLGSSPVRIL